MSEQTPETKPAPLRRDPTTTTVAWAAAIIGTLALAGGIYLEKEREKLKDRIADLRIELRDTEQMLSRRDAEFASRDGLARVEGEGARRILELERRFDQLEAGFDYLRTQAEGARGAWARAEIEHVLRMAIHHLQVERDPRAALIALRAVERRVRELGDPAYVPVLARLALDLAALEDVVMPDFEGITLTLDGIANGVVSLPLKQPEGLREPRVRDARHGFAGVDWSAVWRRVRESFKSMVTIRRAGRPEQVLLAPDEEYFVHLNAQLKVESARIAVQRRDGAAFRGSLRGTRAWIETWYDTDDVTVQAMLEELDTLERVELRPAMPDIGGALRLVRAIGERRSAR